MRPGKPSLDLMDGIYEYLIEDGACLTNGPVFNDYASAGRSAAKVPDDVETSVADDFKDDKLRLWTGLDGKSIEAEFITVSGDKAVLKDARGSLRKIPLAQISAEDRKFIELARPPEFDISFSKTSSQRFLKPSPLDVSELPRLSDYVFCAKLKQMSAGFYGHELRVEFFAIGEEIDGDNYILFDRQESNFLPTKENKGAHQFSGNSVELMDYNFGEQRRGEKYGGYLIVVTDVRGKIIDHGASHEWLFENLEKLKQIPVGRHFDKTITRVHPPRPKRNF
jgi:hypothetical protein